MSTPRSDHQRQLLGGDPVVVPDAGDVRERTTDAARRSRRRRAPTKRTATRVRVPSEADRRTDESKVEDAPPPPTLPTVLSESVVERPVRTSRFKRERQRRDAAAASSSASPTAGGFPSLNAPLGTYLPKTSTTTKTKDRVTTNKDVLGKNPSSMTPEEVRECVDELGATLSAETLAFLKKRGRDKMRAATVAASTKRSDVVPEERDVPTSAPEPTTITTTTVVAPPLVNDTKRKEDTARLLSSIETEEDLDRAYLDSLPFHQRDLSSKNDDDDNDPLVAAASLLRSTSSRQRSLAARRVRIELERLVNDGGDAPSHLPLLPVALRCLLDASPSSPERVALHDDVLRSLRALLRLIGGGSTTPRRSVVVDGETERAADSDDRSSYATTAASASRDGAAFYRDPAWTLLSRMRFVPRAAALAATAREDALCDLLAALAARAPGAAAAIAAPAGPLSALARRALAPAEDFPVRPAPARACLRLLIVAAGTSRTVPETTAGDLYARVAADDLLPILCATARRTDDGARRAVRAAALDLWRVLLGYGLALPRVGTFLRAAAPYLSRRDDDDDDDDDRLFAASWTHALADATDCAAALTACHRFKRTLVLTPHQRDALAGTGALFGPRARECAERPVTAHPAGTAARLRFLASYVAACAPTPLSAALVEGEEEKVFDETLLTRGDFVCALPARACATCLRSMMSDEQWTRALRSALSPTRDDDDHDHDDHYAGIVEHGLTLAHNLSTARFRRYDDDDPADEIDEVLSELGTSVSRTLEEPRARGTDHRQPRRDTPARSAARAWAAIFAARASRDDPARYASVRRLVVDVLGALVPGEEALVILLLEEDASPLPRSVRRVLLRTLRGDGRARAQATHSATRLQIRAVPDHDARGPFALRSRRPDADAAPVAAERRAPPRLLPLGGPSWPWHLLSGGANDDADADDDEEAVEVVRDALILLEELAGEDPGREVYHLCNVALRPEAVVRDDAVDDTFARLFERLVGSSANDDDAFDRSFARACAAHARERATDDDDDDNDEELVGSPFHPPNTDHELRALKDLVDDVRTVFLEHGAQYRACVLVARTLLRPGLPSPVVAEALRGLRGVGSFLDLEEEREDRALLVRRLARQLRAGGPRREPPEVLDALAGTLDGRDPGGYGRALAVARLARDLARATNDTTTALQRLANVTFPASAREAVLRTARAWTSTTGTVEDSAREASSRDEDPEARALARDATDAEEWRRRATAWLSSFRTA